MPFTSSPSTLARVSAAPSSGPASSPSTQPSSSSSSKSLVRAVSLLRFRSLSHLLGLRASSPSASARVSAAPSSAGPASSPSTRPSLRRRLRASLVQAVRLCQFRSLSRLLGLRVSSPSRSSRVLTARSSGIPWSSLTQPSSSPSSKPTSRRVPSSIEISEPSIEPSHELAICVGYGFGSD